MVIIVVLWEVIDPEAVAFIDPWGEQEGKNTVNAPWVHASTQSSLKFGVCGRLWAGPGHRERRKARSGIPGLCGDGHTHRRTAQREQRPGGDHLTDGPRLGTCKSERPTINNCAGTGGIELNCSGQAGHAIPRPRGLQSHLEK